MKEENRGDLRELSDKRRCFRVKHQEKDPISLAKETKPEISKEKTKIL